jgi:hypothetical protein
MKGEDSEQSREQKEEDNEGSGKWTKKGAERGQ